MSKQTGNRTAPKGVVGMLSKIFGFTGAPVRSHLAQISDRSANRRVNLLAVAWAVNVFAFSIIFPFLPIYLHSTRGIPMSKVGLIFLIMGAATIIGSPVSGLLTDRIGRRPVMISGLLLRSLSFFILSLMALKDADFALIAGGLFVSTFLGTFFQNAGNAYIVDLVRSTDREVAYSKLRVGLNLGWMIGPAAGAFLAAYPFWILFLLTGIVCLLTASIVFYFCSYVPVQRADTSPQAVNISYFRLLKNDPVFLLYIAIFSLFFLAVSQFIPLLSIYAKEIVLLNQSQIGMLFTLNGAIVIFFMIPINNRLKHTNIVYRIVWGGVGYIVSYVIFGVSQTWLHLAAGMTILTFGEILSLNATVSLTGRLAPKGMIGRYMGIWGLADGVARAVGPWFGSIIFAQMTYHPLLLWVILSVPAIASSLALIPLGKKESSVIPARFLIAGKKTAGTPATGADE